jgi:hypothetical protein
VYASTDDAIACLQLVERDLKAATRTDSLVLKTAAAPAVQITLKPPVEAS